MQTSTDVLIVGAGPTGLTMAIELQRLGLSTRIVDKSPHAAQWSQALVVQSRTLEQWERYRIADAAIAQGRKLHRGSFFSEGKKILEFHFDQIPGMYPYVLFLPQKCTEELLAEHLASIGGAPIERSTELLSFVQDDSGVVAKLRDANGLVSETRAAWLVGAAGAHSTVRTHLGIPFAGSEVDLSFLLGDLVVDGADAPQNELVVHVRDGEIVFLGQLSDKLCRVICAGHRKEAEELGQRPLNLEDFNQVFRRMGMRLQAKASEWMTPFHVNDRQAAHYASGRVFLAGDASHIHSPVGGQGMNTGIQDAGNLAWKLAAAHRSAPGLPVDPVGRALLDSYEKERVPIGEALLQRTGLALRMASTTNPAVRWVRDHVAGAAEHFEAVQRAAVGFISETAIQYRGSPIVEDHGGPGSLHAGDRVPNSALPDGRRLLEALASARSLLLLVNTPDLPSGIPADTPHLAVLAIDTAANPELAPVFGSAPQMFIIRPDGYLGFRGRASTVSTKVQDHLVRVGAL